MLEKLKSAQNQIGLAPGTLIYSGETKIDKVLIELIEYDENYYQDYVFETFEDLSKKPQTNYKKWLNIKGIHDIELLTKIGECFNINTLTIEDILNTHDLPKIEFLDSYILIILKDTNYIDNKLCINQISLIIGSNFIITFQETDETIFKDVKNRLLNSAVFQKREVSYLGYSIIDLIVDTEFKTLYHIGEIIEKLETRLLNDPEPSITTDIHKLKSDILTFRSLVRPLRNLVNIFEKEESTVIKDNLKIYIRDLNDHVVQLSEITEIYRETISHLMDIYLSSANNRMSEVMKVLTIIATIFIPLTFLAGIYGMNFKYMPELEWQYGYYTVLSIMGLIIICMLIFFRKKKWL